MPAFTVLNGSIKTRRARVVVIALLIIVFLLFLSNSRLGSGGGYLDSADAGQPQAPGSGNSAAGGDAVQLPPPHGNQDKDKELPVAHGEPDPAGEKLKADADGEDSYRNKDEELVKQPPTDAGRPGNPKPSDSATMPLPPTPPADCESFENWMRKRPGPASEGKRQFPLNRPRPECRTFRLPAMENLITRMKGVIKDPDLYRLFENAYPMTLDSMVKWRGFANETDKQTGETRITDQELTYVITGDIDALWLRDSAEQISPYLPLLEASEDKDSLASLWRGLINAHSRYIIISPYCHSFQPPPESGIPPTHNGAYVHNHPMPAYDPEKVFDCKWELDSLASFLKMSVSYAEKTGDWKFFSKYNWVDAVEAAVNAAGAMRLGTYSTEGKVEKSAWTFTGWTNRGSETLTNDGLGNPIKENGMIRTAFRPSDDACIFQFLVPANMMWAKYLESASEIMAKLDGEKARKLTEEMRAQAFGIRHGIEKDAIVHRPGFGDIFAYEVDGYGGANLMDDANVPSLLAMPLWNFTQSNFKLPDPPKGEKQRDYAEVYRNTRKYVLSDSNSYFMKGPVISAVGGPHVGPGKAWPMAAVIAAITAYDPISGIKDVEKEVEEQLRMVLDSTAGTGVLHESVNSWNENDWTRAWFGWANGLFGELLLRVEDEEKKKKGGDGGLLGKSWQDSPASNKAPSTTVNSR
ncbi:meiotically up-regulated gene 157 protein [Colletotrichum spaethianum]|uniref:Meiotically up-regulated gene 157 protein n=1 Tax=Colletotrichum spaethianum TaxID=700344 RepID=A0AA37L947_9PEZI|nr:meiotically up-regulated gene 157 protein [Colletotrichum spaethianum]GKT42969.1 meiotically up-regulated gene 157 protein [Colletotrichum spaethianum]